ncbi:hypothetical protein NQ314_018197, partial [Rhamnusium bicolor]
MYKCNACLMQSTYKNNVIRHLKRVHGIEEYKESASSYEQKSETSLPKEKSSLIFCKSCNLEIASEKFSSHQRSLSHKQNSGVEIEPGVYLINSAFKRNISTYRIKYDSENDVMLFPQKKEDDDEACIKNEVKSFNSKYEMVTISRSLDEIYSHFYNVLKTKSEEFEEQDSGWSLLTLLFLEINMLKYNPMRASSFIPLPPDIYCRKAIVNVKNFDLMCFKWACLSALHPSLNNPDRIANYEPYSNELNFNDISFPMELKNIAKFEKNNEHISINVFGLEKSPVSSTKIKHNIIGPLYHTKMRKVNHINLLYLEAENSNNGHFCWIKNMSRLVGCQINKHGHAVFICDGCLVFFQRESDLEEHLKRGDCAKVCTILPKPGEHYLQFKDFHRSFPVPFTIYSDFEAILNPIENCEPNPEKKYVINSQIHEAYSFAYYVKCHFDNSLSFIREYRGKNCTSVYVKWLVDDVRHIYKKYFSNVIPMKALTSEELSKHEAATTCFICTEPFSTAIDESTTIHNNEQQQLNMVKVRDHDHFTVFFFQVKLELLTDVDMVHFIRKSIRGGIVQCSHRYAKANNRYMPQRDVDDCLRYLSYKSDEDTQYLLYLDANN